MTREGDLDLEECQYRDPNVKTFAWWQAAMKRDERNCATIQPGFVVEASDDDTMELDPDPDPDLEISSERRKRSRDSEDEVEHTGGYGGWNKCRRYAALEVPFYDTETDALFAQFL